MIRIYEVDDWQIAKDMKTGKHIMYGHNVERDLLENLKVDFIWLEGEDVARECELTGSFEESIKKYEEAERNNKNG